MLGNSSKVTHNIISSILFYMLILNGGISVWYHWKALCLYKLFPELMLLKCRCMVGDHGNTLPGKRFFIKLRKYHISYAEFKRENPKLLPLYTPDHI